MADDPADDGGREALAVQGRVIATGSLAREMFVAMVEMVREPEGARTAVELLFELATARHGFDAARALFTEVCSNPKNVRDDRLRNLFDAGIRQGSTTEQIAAYLMSPRGDRMRKYLGLNPTEADSLRKRLNRLSDKTGKNVR